MTIFFWLLLIIDGSLFDDIGMSRCRRRMSTTTRWVLLLLLLLLHCTGDLDFHPVFFQVGND